LESYNNIAAGSQNDIIKNLRIATFGTSITWGAKLDNRYDAYPYLLSQNVNNLAIRGCGSHYPNICLQSMIGEDAIYDVIIIEYTYGQEALVQLTRRVRQRFPEAVIIILRIWTPCLIGFKKNEEEEEWESVMKWLKEKDFEPNSPEAIDVIHQSSKYWEFDDEFRDAFYDASRGINTYLYEWKKTDSVKDMLFSNLNKFDSDWVHLSKYGHFFVAKDLRKLIETVRPRVSNKLGSWGSGDKCYNWYTTGVCPLEHDSRIVMEKYDEIHDKHALRIPVVGGNITVINPFEEKRPIMLTYTATSPVNQMYPKVEVTVIPKSQAGLKEQAHFHKAVIDPVIRSYDRQVHVLTSAIIGVADPGENYLNFITLSKRIAPFRLVAVSIIGKELLFQNFTSYFLG